MTVGAITLLLEDNETLRKLPRDFADTSERTADARKKLLQRLEGELKARATIEEELPGELAP